MDIRRDDHVVDEHRIDADAHHDEEALKRQRKQALEIVRADAAPLAVAHRSNRDWRNAHGAVNLNHSAVENDRDQDGHDLEAQADNHGLDGQAKQFSDAHFFHAGTHLFQSGLDVYIRIAAYYSGCTGNNILSDVENSHNDVESVRHEVDRHSRLEKPLEKHPCVHVR